jgi:hypothetical protein
MRKARLMFFALALSFGWTTAMAQAASVSATCKDGSSWTGKSRRGACSKHGGVQSFVTAAPAPAAMAAPAATPPPARASAPQTSSPTTTMAPAPRGVAGNGQVWVNTSSKVYHCQGDRYYGKTKAGSYMSESAARAEGDRPSRGKACS